MTKIIAHRGASGYQPENTLPAFTRAVEMGADGIELDIHSTADGLLAVFHNGIVGGVPIGHLTFDGLQDRVDLPQDEVVPELETVLARVGGSLTVYIEVKTLDPGCDARLLEAIAASPRPDACQVHSFDHRIIKRLLAASPGLVGGALSSSYPLDPIGPVRACGATVLWQARDQVDADLVTAVKAAGLQLITFTVDRPGEVKQMADLGVDAICTNTPDVARKALA